MNLLLRQPLAAPNPISPGEDNIVRNYARILSKRLEEYFARDRGHEPLRIVIPRGTYVPVFAPNTTLEIVAAPFRESTVLQFAFAYQQSTEWHRRTPPILRA